MLQRPPYWVIIQLLCYIYTRIKIAEEIILMLRIELMYSKNHLLSTTPERPTDIHCLNMSFLCAVKIKGRTIVLSLYVPALIQCTHHMFISVSSRFNHDVRVSQQK